MLFALEGCRDIGIAKVALNPTLNPKPKSLNNDLHGIYIVLRVGVWRCCQLHPNPPPERLAKCLEGRRTTSLEPPRVCVLSVFVALNPKPSSPM